MDEGSDSSDATHSAVQNLGRGDRSPAEPDESEGAQSSNKYRRIDREGARSSATSEQASRFLFVDSSSSVQRRRSDQRAINAHIQQTAHRNRKQAAQKQKTSGAANIGRYRREPVLQPRPSEPQRIAIAPANTAQRTSISVPSSTTFSSPVASSSSSHLQSQDSTPAPGRPRSPPGVDHGQFDRLLHYNNVRRPEVQNAVDSQRDEQNALSTEVARRMTSEEKTKSVRSMLTQILQRLDAGHAGHSIPGTSHSSLRNTALDPFNFSSVHITPSMDATLRHCECRSNLFCLTVEFNMCSIREK